MKIDLFVQGKGLSQVGETPTSKDTPQITVYEINKLFFEHFSP